ncbi:hypothetical protein AVEN_125623-1 [Araneus ventricosus]|uniref:Uncharacterized protein n=1 Tax=Araneus ventricosus TaxID=182803 RepID=A0A4Y2J1W2_ARAVE|nr:hypothetical protein AVEN_125623-1 [Araneus ventricosus]
MSPEHGLRSQEGKEFLELRWKSFSEIFLVIRDCISLYYCGCGEIGNSLHYARRRPHTLSYHHKEPSPQFIVHWWKSALSRKLSRRNIDNLMPFLATNEDLIKSQNTSPSHTPA